MRIAVLIIGIVLSIVMAVQTLTVYALGSAVNSEEGAGSGAIGLLAAFLILVGSAFAIGLPLVSVVLFAIAGLLSLLAGMTTAFGDLVIWGSAALILMAMAFIGWRGKRRADLRARLEREEHRDLLRRVALASERPAPD